MSDALDGFLGSLRAFCDRHVHAAQIDAAGTVEPEVWQGLRELGVYGLTFPAEYGGSALRLRDACAVVDALAAYDRSVAVSIGVHLGIGSRGVIDCGSESLKARVLPKMASGEWVGAFAATEADAGSDLLAIRTRATPTPTGWSVFGNKAFITNGAFAEVITVVGRDEKHSDRGVSAWVVQRGDGGVVSGREESKFGLKGSSTTGLLFEGAPVRTDAQLKTAADDSDPVSHTLAWGRTLLGAGCASAAARAHHLALEYTADRRQFGRPLREFEVVAHQLEEDGLLARAAQRLVMLSADHADEPGFELISMAAKIFASETAWAVTDRSLQLHGAVGYLEASGLPLILRDLRVPRIFEGANDVLLGRIGLALLVNPDAVLVGPQGATHGHALIDLKQEISAARAQKKLALVRHRRWLHWMGARWVWAVAQTLGAPVGVWRWGGALSAAATPEPHRARPVAWVRPAELTVVPDMGVRG